MDKDTLGGGSKGLIQVYVMTFQIKVEQILSIIYNGLLQIICRRVHIV